jgi:hypothetical protein
LVLEVEILHFLVVFELFLMEQLRASENTREKIDIEPFQNEKLMDDTLVT